MMKQFLMILLVLVLFTSFPFKAQAVFGEFIDRTAPARVENGGTVRIGLVRETTETVQGTQPGGPAEEVSENELPSGYQLVDEVPVHMEGNPRGQLPPGRRDSRQTPVSGGTPGLYIPAEPPKLIDLDWLTVDEFRELLREEIAEGQIISGNTVSGSYFEYAINEESDEFTRRVKTLHWDWTINNLDSPNGDTTLRTPGRETTHEFGYTGEYNITALPWTVFERVRRTRWIAYVQRDVDVPVLDANGNQAVDAEGNGVYRNTTIFDREHRERIDVLNTWEAHDTSRRMNFNVIIGLRDLNRRIRLPANPPNEPLPDLKYELTD